MDEFAFQLQWQALQKRFRQGLPVRRAALLAATADLAQSRFLLHQLAGAAGSYDLSDLALAARVAEAQCRPSVAGQVPAWLAPVLKLLDEATPVGEKESQSIGNSAAATVLPHARHEPELQCAPGALQPPATLGD